MIPLRGISVLVIEDNEDVRDLTAFLLERRGARVRVAENGAEGLAKLQEECPNLVLCDLMMPIMGGIEFARSVRRLPEYAYVRLVALTSRRDDGAYQRVMEAGFHAFLQKPFDPATFEALVARLLPEPDPPRPP
jgi:CheY-like chemotaxis protein